MTRQQHLKLLLLFCLTVSLLQSNAISQQITAEGDVSTNNMQVPSNLGAVAQFGDLFIGDLFFESFASGRLTVSDGASLVANFIAVQSNSILEAQGIGTTATIQQGLDLSSGSLSVTDGATVNTFGLSTQSGSLFAPTINVSGFGSQLLLGSGFLERGTINVSDGAAFSSGIFSLAGNVFPLTRTRMNLTGGGQAVIGDLELGFDLQSRNEVSIDEDSSLFVMSNLSIGGDNTVTLQGGMLFGSNSININDSGELRGYGDITSQIQLEGSSQSVARLTVDADQTLRTFGILNFTGQISNFGTLDAGINRIENLFDGHYLAENSTIRAESFINDGMVNLIGGRNFVEANLENQREFNVSGGASVFFTRGVLNNGIIHTADGSTSTFLGSLFGSGAFEGAGDVLILGDFNPGNSPGLVTFEGDLEFAAGSSTEIELGGTDRSTAMQSSSDNRFDAFDVNGTLTLGGELDVVLLDGFELESGQEFMIAEVDSVQAGQFNGLAEGALVGNFGDTDLFISYVAGDGNDVSLFTVAVPDIVLGDSNLDGIVDFSDIPAFIEILTNGTFLEQADVNQDGEVNFSDIAGFIDILIGN